MIALLVLKEKLKQFYSKYSIYVTLAVKFLLGCLTFALISGNIGFMVKIKQSGDPDGSGSSVCVPSIWSDRMSGCSSGACPFEQCVIGTDPDSGGMFPDHRDFCIMDFSLGTVVCCC